MRMGINPEYIFLFAEVKAEEDWDKTFHPQGLEPESVEKLKSKHHKEFIDVWYRHRFYYNK